jgi:hypothetical protein
LEASYRFQKKEIEQVLETLLRSKELVLEQAEIVSRQPRRLRRLPDRVLCRDRCWHVPAGLIGLLVQRND